MRHFAAALLVALTLNTLTIRNDALAQETPLKKAPAAAQALPKVEAEVLAGGLQNPSAIALQPNSSVVFISESGAGRVARLVEGKLKTVVEGFPRELYGPGPQYRIGPLGLAFLAPDLLIVGDGGDPDGVDQVRVFNVPENPETSLDANKTKANFALGANGETKGEGNFFGLAVTAKGVFVTCNGDDEKGWLAKLERNGRNVGPSFDRFVATKLESGLNAPAAITVSPAGELVVGQMGQVKKPGDSQLSFYSETGKALAHFKTGLSDISGLAYSPRGNLYATDFSWADPSKGGLFQIVATRKGRTQVVSAKRILSLVRPTALAFSADGSLFITVYGSGVGDSKTGQLLRVKPGL